MPNSIGYGTHSSPSWNYSYPTRTGSVVHSDHGLSHSQSSLDPNSYDVDSLLSHHMS